MEMKAPATMAQPQPPSGGVQPRLVAAGGGMFDPPTGYGEQVKEMNKA